MTIVHALLFASVGFLLGYLVAVLLLKMPGADD